MSARLRVEELRADLQRRGLDFSGNKPALVSLPTSPQFVTRRPRNPLRLAFDFFPARALQPGE
jgi:hypothetical protein